MAVTPLVIRDANAKDSLFLSKLPGEMRNKIYRLALLDESVVVDYKAIHDKTALLRTSTQLREEASVIFYRESKFIVTNAPAQGPDLAKLLQAMGAENRHNIDKVVMQHKLPEVVSQRLKLLEDYCKSGLSMAAAAKKAAKDFGFSDDATFNDLLGSIYNNAIGPVKAVSGMLVHAGIPMTSLGAVAIGANTDAKDGLVEMSEKQILAGMAEAFMEAGTAEWAKMQGIDSSVQWDYNALAKLYAGEIEFEDE